jgi:hypothetical protein
LMQHALKWMWDRATAQNSSRPSLSLNDYFIIGGLGSSLGHQADEVLAQSTPLDRDILRRVFCLLVDSDDRLTVRRPTRIAEICAVADCTVEIISAVTGSFRAPGCGLLLPPLESILTPETSMDITHEALIRHWDTLREWTRAELDSAAQYRQIVIDAEKWARGHAGLREGVALDLALAWRDQEQPTAAWAARYGGDFELTMRFLDESARQRPLIFLSHSSKDRETTSAIYEALKDHGFNCWMASRDIRGGEDFADAIVRAIRGAKAMVLVFSAHANRSNEIKKELALADQSGVPVIPVRLEDIQPEGTLAYQLSTRQWINLFENWELSIRDLAQQLANTAFQC